MSNRIVAIGDIHGEYMKLTTLMYKLMKAGASPLNDTFVFLGDYVDGGPDTSLVVSALIEFSKLFPHWVFLKGNHEDMLASAYWETGKYQNEFLLWYTQGGMETVHSYLGDSHPEPANSEWLRGVIPEEHVLWLHRLPLFYETEKFFFVHAGVQPDSRPDSVSENDALWIRNTFIKSKFDWGKVIVAGHTAFDEPLVQPNKILLDTMRHGYGSISAAILDDDTGEILEIVQS